MIKIKSKIFFLFIVVIITSQLVAKLETLKNEGITIEYPSDGSIFPPDITPPTIIWKDAGGNSDFWIITAEIDSKNLLKIKSDKLQWKPSKDDWRLMKQNSSGKDLKITISGYKKDKQNLITSSASINISTSKDSVIAPVFYRDVPLPFSFALKNLEKVRWRLGYIDEDTTAKVVMEKLPVCANCHTFSFDGKTIGMDVDAHSDKDAYGIAHIEPNTVMHKMIRWSASQNNSPTYGLLSAASPDGNFFISTLHDNEFFVVQEDLAYSQLFFPIKGILKVYDRNKDKFWNLQGANDTNLVSTNPTWSPDEKYIYFCRAVAIPSEESGFIDAFKRDSIRYKKLVDDFYSEKRHFKYDIYRLPFNGGNGGKEEMVKGASANGMSNYFPRISPNGKWLVYTQAKNFMLLQPDSKLWIIPAEGGTPRELKCNVEGLMNSWHSWSPNSRWLVFSSKRQGLYTKLYLTHIDENGNDSPAILLENHYLPERAANLPEFVNIKKGEFLKIEPKFLNNDYFSFQEGIRKFKNGNFVEALKDFDKAAIVDSTNYMVFGARGYTLASLGRFPEALDDYNKALSIKSTDGRLYNLRGFARVETADYNGAIEDFEKAVSINSNDAESYNGLGYAKTLIGKFQESIPDFDKAIKINPGMYEAIYQRGLAYYNLDSINDAKSNFSKVIEIMPKFHFAYLYRGLCNIQLDKKEMGCNDFIKAIELGSKAAEETYNKLCK
jgi:tetratricopeptide (TPR) repeat protein